MFEKFFKNKHCKFLNILKINQNILKQSILNSSSKYKFNKYFFYKWNSFFITTSINLITMLQRIILHCINFDLLEKVFLFVLLDSLELCLTSK
jgi:hypothetical protein